MSDTDTSNPPPGDIEVVEGTGVELEEAPHSPITQHAHDHNLPMLPGEVRAHASPFGYTMIALVLVVLTALEVGAYYLEGDVADGLLVFALLLMMVVKFALVASWYMHLRTDQRIFRRIFVVGVCAAVVLYLIVLTTLHIFSGGS